MGYTALHWASKNGHFVRHCRVTGYNIEFDFLHVVAIVYMYILCIELHMCDAQLQKEGYLAHLYRHSSLLYQRLEPSVPETQALCTRNSGFLYQILRVSVTETQVFYTSDLGFLYEGPRLSVQDNWALRTRVPGFLYQRLGLYWSNLALLCFLNVLVLVCCF